MSPNIECFREGRLETGLQTSKRLHFSPLALGPFGTRYGYDTRQMSRQCAADRASFRRNAVRFGERALHHQIYMLCFSRIGGGRRKSHNSILETELKYVSNPGRVLEADPDRGEWFIVMSGQRHAHRYSEKLNSTWPPIYHM